MNKLNNISNNTVKHIVGTNAYPDTESQLDIQMMGINVPNADLWFWTENNWLYSMAVELFYSKNVPDVVSMSWGWAEDQQCTIAECTNETSKQYVDRVNAEYVKLGVYLTLPSGSPESIMFDLNMRLLVNKTLNIFHQHTRKTSNMYGFK